MWKNSPERRRISMSVEPEPFLYSRHGNKIAFWLYHGIDVYYNLDKKLHRIIQYTGIFKEDK